MLRDNIKHYHRRIKLVNYFEDAEFTPSLFTLTSNWEPKWKELDKEVRKLIRLDDQHLFHFQPVLDQRDNISRAERQALRELKTNPDIVIKPADKGSKVVIMDTFQYAYEAKRQLNNPAYYTPIGSSIQNETT